MGVPRRKDEIAQTSEGLLYLDWMRGERGGVNDIDAALEAYLDDPSIQDDLKGVF
jgi:hypothetical protein